VLDDNSIFKERVNDTITNLQLRIENIEHNITSNKLNIKTMTNSENEIKKLTTSLDSLKKSLNKFSKNEENNKINQQQHKKSINEKILNIVKINDAKYDELNNKFIQLLNELDMIRRDTKNTEPIYIQSIKKDIKEINKKIESFDKKLSNIDVTKLSKNIEIKVKKSDRDHIENEIKEHIKLISEDITNRIQNIEITNNTSSDQKYEERLTNIEQQMICQMTNIHNMSNQLLHYNFFFS